eukprot:6122512-Pyramimonas_sp.AAC.5
MECRDDRTAKDVDTERRQWSCALVYISLYDSYLFCACQIASSCFIEVVAPAATAKTSCAAGTAPEPLCTFAGTGADSINVYVSGDTVLYCGYCGE